MVVQTTDFTIATYASNRVFSPAEDAVAFKLITNDRLALEKSLFASKWFDYRFMSPVEATIAFADELTEAGKEVYAANFDSNKAKFFKINRISSGSSLVASANSVYATPKNKRLLAGYWRARQLADAIGMPYRLWGVWALSQRLRNWKRGVMPQPTMLCDSRDAEKVMQRWLEERKVMTLTAQHPAFKLENYCGLPVQDEYHEFLIENSTPAGLAFHVKEGRLPAEKCRGILRGDDTAIEQFERFLT